MVKLNYYEDVDTTAPTKEEEKEYLKEIKQGNKEKEKEFITRNLGLVFKILKKYEGFYNIEDILQEGVIGLIRAVQLYDEKEGTRFSTYAYPAIQRTITRYLDTQTELRTPPNQRYINYMLNDIWDKYYKETGRFITKKEHIEKADVSEGQYERYIIEKGRRYFSKDESILRNTNTNYGELVGILDINEVEEENTEISVEDKLLIEEIKTYVKENFTNKKYLMFALKYGLTDEGRVYTNAEIGKIMGCSHQNVCESNKKLLQDIRKHLKLDRESLR